MKLEAFIILTLGETHMQCMDGCGSFPNGVVVFLSSSFRSAYYNLNKVILLLNRVLPKAVLSKSCVYVLTI